MVNKQAGDRLRFKGLTPSSLGEGGKRLPTLRGECGTALPWGPRCGSSSEKQRGVSQCSRTAWQLLSPAVTRAGRTHAHAKLCVCV